MNSDPDLIKTLTTRFGNCKNMVWDKLQFQGKGGVDVEMMDYMGLMQVLNAYNATPMNAYNSTPKYHGHRITWWNQY